MLFSEASFSEFITVGLALFGIGAVAVAQCGGNKRPEKKKLSAQPASAKSKRAVSSKSSRSARKPTVKKGLAQQAQKSRSSKKSKSSKSSKSLRKSKRSAVDKKSARSGKAAAASLKKSARGPVKSERSSKEPSTAKEVSAKQALSSKEQNSAAAKKNQGVLQSLKDVADSKLYLSQKSLLHGKGADKVELQMEPRQLKFDSSGGLQKVRLHNPSNVRQAIKVKCSDNNLFRVSPVFSLIEPGAGLNLYVVRHAGEGKLDKIVVLTSDVPDSAEANLQELFSKISPESNVPMLVLPLVA